MKRRIVTAGVLASLWLATSSANAGPREEAEAYKTLGREAFKAGKYQECASHFRKSYSLHAEPSRLFNVGLCHERAGDIDAALQAFSEYLNVAPKGERAAEAKTRVELLELKRQARAPEEGEPKTTDPKTTGPKTTGPKTTDPKTTDPKTTDPKTTGLKTTDPTTDPKTTELRNPEEGKSTQPVEEAKSSAVLPTPRPFVRPAASKSYSRPVGNIFLAVDLGGLQFSNDDGTGPALLLDFRGNFGSMTGGSGFYIGMSGHIGSLDKDGDSALIGGFGLDVGLLLGGPRASAFLAPGLGMIGYGPTNDSGIGFDLRVTSGLALGITQAFELRPVYRYHLLDGLGSYGLSLGYRFSP